MTAPPGKKRAENGGGIKTGPGPSDPGPGHGGRLSADGRAAAVYDFKGAVEGLPLLGFAFYKPGAVDQGHKLEQLQVGNGAQRRMLVVEGELGVADLTALGETEVAGA